MQSEKSYYEKMLLQMVCSLKSHLSPGKTRLELGAFAAGYGTRIAGMEGFSRVLWGLVPYWAGGGTDRKMLPVILEGIINGTDPAHEEYWGDLHDKDQRMVEMAAIANGLLLTPELLWKPLGDKAKENLATWLYQINLYTQAENNWQFFNVIVNLALKKRGRKYSLERMQEAIDKYESFYLGNGWYSDGKRPQKDYYSSFAIQYYCLLYAFYEGGEEPERAAKYRERAVLFAKSFQYWFDDEGKGLPFGRSLTYRFGEAAFFSACVMTGVECLPWGVVKGILFRHLRYWMKQPMYDNGGVLTVGYTYPNLLMSEGYNSPGSPYWALKAFAFLALPKTHPFWSVKEEPLPKREPFYLIPEAQMLMADRPGEVIAYTAGQYSVLPYSHDAEKYEKFAYSSRFGFSVPRSYCSLRECAPDSMLAFEINGMLHIRRRCLEYKLTEQAVWAKWSPVEGIVVETTVVPAACGHIRKHKILSDRECVAYDSGFAYPFCQEDTVITYDGGEVDHSSCNSSRAVKIADENGYSLAETRRGNGKVIAIEVAPNTNLIFPLTRIPSVEYAIKAGVTEIETWFQTEFTTQEIRIGGGKCYEVQNNGKR